MKIVHILSADSGGAGLAALRLHQALLASNIDSDILCFYKQSKVPHVVCVERTTCTKILMRLPIPFKNGKYKKSAIPMEIFMNVFHFQKAMIA